MYSRNDNPIVLPLNYQDAHMMKVTPVYIYSTYMHTYTLHIAILQWNLYTLNKGHLSTKDKLCGPYRTMAIQFYLLKRTASL